MTFDRLDSATNRSLNLLFNAVLVSDAEIHILYKGGEISVLCSLKKGFEDAMIDAAMKTLDNLRKKIKDENDLKKKERYVDSL